MQHLKIGDEWEGGIIFFLDDTGQHGLIVSPTDLSGTADWDEAVQACNEYNGGNKEDWRLPSIEELQLLYQQKIYAREFERFSYWSATEYATHFAWFLNFFNGETAEDFKDNTCYVRAIRNF
jgi:hypothetical protein